MDDSHKNEWNKWRRVSIKIAVFYMIASGLWFLFSDRLVHFLAQEFAGETFWQTAKGWFFVIVTGLGLYWVIQREFANRSRAEEALQERELQLSTLITAMPDFVVFKDEEGRWLEANAYAVQLFELQGIPYQGKTDTELAALHPIHRDTFLVCSQSDQMVFATNQQVRLEETVVRSDGTTVIFDVIKVPFAYAGGKRTGIVAIGRDITVRKRMECELEESNQRYYSIIGHNSAAIFSLDKQGHYLSANPAAERLTGYTEAELLERNILHFADVYDLPLIRDHFEQALLGESQSYDITIPNKTGYSADLRIANVPMKVNGEVVGIYGIVNDVTEIKRTDDLLRKSDKLALVGQLAAGVAHEIRNPLTAIKGFTQLLKLRGGDESGYYQIMLSELDRIEFIISEFLVLAKPQAVDFEPRNLQTLIKNIATLFDTQAIMSNVQIELQLAGDAPYVNCEENQLKQVFVNILKNSVDAMPQGGTVRIQVSRGEEEQALIRIIDEGVGIDPKRLPNLGEPFYTTKEKGTGLGLMVSYKIIKDHKGRIDIFSEVGIGTTVEIRLPICEKLRLVKN